MESDYEVLVDWSIAADSLVREALERGCGQDATVVVLFFHGAGGGRGGQQTTGGVSGRRAGADAEPQSEAQKVTPSAHASALGPCEASLA